MDIERGSGRRIRSSGQLLQHLAVSAELHTGLLSQPLDHCPAEASTDTGGTVTIDQDANISQPRTGRRMAKAMVFVAPHLAFSMLQFRPLGSRGRKTAVRFFLFNIQEGITILDFGFRIDDRFLSVTAAQTN